MGDQPADRSAQRASDDDRERMAETLREAAAHGRITFDELDERLNRVYAAKTYAELEPVARDLPVASAKPEEAGAVEVPSGRVAGVPRHKLSLGFIGRASRVGAWVVPRNYVAAGAIGGVSLDLRQASYAEGEVTIRGLALLGELKIIVPEGAAVEISGLEFMGQVRRKARSAGAPGAPRIRIVGLALMGRVNVRRAHEA